MRPDNYQPPGSKWFTDNELTPPSTTPHGSDSDIAAQLIPIKPHSWKLQGNQLIGYAEAGVISQKIPTNVILTGQDERGLPIFKRV